MEDIVTDWATSLHERRDLSKIIKKQLNDSKAIQCMVRSELFSLKLSSCFPFELVSGIWSGPIFPLSSFPLNSYLGPNFSLHFIQVGYEISFKPFYSRNISCFKLKMQNWYKINHYALLSMFKVYNCLFYLIYQFIINTIANENATICLRFDWGTGWWAGGSDCCSSDHQPWASPGDGVQQALQVPGNHHLTEKGQYWIVKKRLVNY